MIVLFRSDFFSSDSLRAFSACGLWVSRAESVKMQICIQYNVFYHLLSVSFFTSVLKNGRTLLCIGWSALYSLNDVKAVCTNQYTHTRTQIIKYQNKYGYIREKNTFLSNICSLSAIAAIDKKKQQQTHAQNQIHAYSVSLTRFSSFLFRLSSCFLECFLLLSCTFLFVPSIRLQVVCVRI